LRYLDDDGTPVEPQFYVPIIPMVLVNGSKGIGTGFSTEIMCYNPLDIINCLKNKLCAIQEKVEFFPYYEGFTGEIEKIEKVDDIKFVFKGKYEKIDKNKIRVTELPVGFWTADFKELLCDLQNDKDKEGKKIVPLIKDVFENYTDTTIDCVITFSNGKIDELESDKFDYGANGIEKLLKLYSTSSTTNMNLFNSEDKLKKYENVEEIIDDYYEIRLEHYEFRKNYMIDTLEKEIVILSNKVRYIKENLEDTIDLRKKKKQEIIDMLLTKGYDRIENDEEFKYLVKMPMDSVSEENVEKLVLENQIKEDELERIKSITIEQMWLSELTILENEYQEYQKERKQAQLGEIKKKKSVVKVTGGAKVTGVVKVTGGVKVTGAKKVIKKSTNVNVFEEVFGEDIVIQPKKKQTNK
jgi:DNA topoisomerase-2